MDAKMHTKNPAHGKVGNTLAMFPITRNMPIMKTITARRRRKLDPDSMKRRRLSNL
jgi:hypothetical protein